MNFVYGCYCVVLRAPGVGAVLGTSCCHSTALGACKCIDGCHLQGLF